MRDEFHQLSKDKSARGKRNTTGRGACLASFINNRRANTFIIFALVAPILLLVIGGAVDWSFYVGSKRALQDANDAATLAASAAVAKNPNMTEANAKTLAQNLM